MSNYLNYLNSSNYTGNSSNYTGNSRFFQTLEYDGTKENLEENVDALLLIVSYKSLIDTLKIIKNEIIKKFSLYRNYKYILIRDIKIINTSEKAKGTYYYFDDKLKPVMIHKSHMKILYILILTFLIFFLILLVVCYYYKVNIVKYVDIYDFFINW